MKRLLRYARNDVFLLEGLLRYARNDFFLLEGLPRYARNDVVNWGDCLPFADLIRRAGQTRFIPFYSTRLSDGQVCDDGMLLQADFS